MSDEIPHNYVLLKDGRLLDITPLEENLNPLLLTGADEWEEVEDISIEDIMEAEELSEADAKKIIASGESGDGLGKSFVFSDEDDSLDEDHDSAEDEEEDEDEDEEDIDDDDEDDDDDFLYAGDEDEDEGGL